jgi:type I restriction enzyme S subunit
MKTKPSIPLGNAIKSANPGFACGTNAPTGLVQLRMNNVTISGLLDWSSIRRVPKTAAKIEKYLLENGDVVFNHTNSPELVGKSAHFGGFSEPVTYSNHFLRLRVQESQLDSRFLAYWLNFQWKTRIFESLCTQWVNQATVRRDDLLEIPIRLPDLAEQKRIAAILERADRLRRLRRYALEMAQELPTTLFANLLGIQVRNRDGCNPVRHSACPVAR